MKILITGGAGFIGSNAVKRFFEAGWEITIIDDLSRQGVEANLQWLKEMGAECKHYKIDISETEKVENFFKDNRFDVILHLAAQVAVTTSVTEPRRDFEINALGTFNLLEAVRKCNSKAIFINASTNKVYGKLSNFKIIEESKRYILPEGIKGVTEETNLDYYSPYGCSKGVADQYSIDYSRIYSLKTVTLRQSCIYGPRQFGVEDQGWVAWFIIAHLLCKPITIYGNGKQVRDILYVDDLIDLYFAAIKNIDKVCGQALNVGGGLENAISLLGFFDILEKYSGKSVVYSSSDWRPGDQPLYISDNQKAYSLSGWKPKTRYQQGIKLLFDWVNNNLALFK